MRFSSGDMDFNDGASPRHASWEGGAPSSGWVDPRIQLNGRRQHVSASWGVHEARVCLDLGVIMSSAASPCLSSSSRAGQAMPVHHPVFALPLLACCMLCVSPECRTTIHHPCALPLIVIRLRPRLLAHACEPQVALQQH
jgi:hypothetical protein